MIQSASLQRGRSSSKFPMEIFAAAAALKKAAGLDFFAASRPACTILLRSAAEPGRLAGRHDIQQQHRDAGIGEVRGDARAHGSRTQHHDFVDATFHSRPISLSLYQRTGYETNIHGSGELTQIRLAPRLTEYG